MQITISVDTYGDDKYEQERVTRIVADYLDKPVRSMNIGMGKNAGYIYSVVGKEKQTDLPLWNKNPPEVQSTFYCLFYPLGIYCSFGASNIHHAYNKAAKHWGARAPIAEPTMTSSDYRQDYRIKVTPRADDLCAHHKLISQTLMTKLVKAWREEQAK